jgi:hypothetical protein
MKIFNRFQIIIHLYTQKIYYLEMKSPSTPTKPVVQNDTDSYNVAFSLQERLTNANKSSSSLRSFSQRDGRSTPNLPQGNDTNSIHIHTDDGSHFIN